MRSGAIAPKPVPAAVRCIILDEDPQREIETIGDNGDDDGMYDANENGDSPGLEAVGDGIGEEDCDAGEGDECDDEEDPSAENAGNSSKKSPQRRALPIWLVEAFKVRLANASQRDQDGWPKLYAIDQTFWFLHRSTYSFLQQNASPQLLYNPCFFLWDLEALCSQGIPCPNCHHRLYRHTHISRPHRCVDIDSTFWIIGYRYRCPNCVHAKSGKHTVTFRSWDSRILAVLPPFLAEEFPAYLSHRSAMSKKLFESMRCCFQNGMGPKQFSDALRVQHLLQYDALRLQYYCYLSSCKIMDGFLNRKYEAFPEFDDIGPNDPHGFTPSGLWLRDMYDKYIERYQDQLNQHTAMLPATICGIDHSHKVTSCLNIWLICAAAKSLSRLRSMLQESRANKSSRDSYQLPTKGERYGHAV